MADELDKNMDIEEINNNVEEGQENDDAPSEEAINRVNSPK